MTQGLRAIFFTALFPLFGFVGCHTSQDPDAGIPWIAIKGGEFTQGISLDAMQKELARPGRQDVLKWYLPREIPSFQTRVESFEILKTEVTVEQYKRCVEQGKCRVPEQNDFCTYYRPDPERLPMNCVDWNDAKTYCEFIGARLPTEAEWEYAARGQGDDIRYPWGEAEPNCNLAITDQGGRGCGRRTLWPVCSVPKGNTAQGLCDMAGNAWEWTADVIAPYPGFEKLTAEQIAQPVERLFFKGYHVIRGGGINSIQDFRTTLRGCHEDTFKYGGLSFRCVR